MARSRNIKPSLFKNEILGVADPLYTLAFQGLWLLADRAGRLEDRPLRIKAETFPYRDGLNIDVILNWLEEEGFILRYQVCGTRYIQVLNFSKHQNPHKNESASDIPPPEQSEGAPKKSVHVPSKSEALALIPDSLNLIPDSPCSDAGASVVASNMLPTCPHNEIIAIYSDTLPTLSQPRMWKGARPKNLAARWRWVLDDLKKKSKPHDREAGIAFFRRMFEYISRCDLLMGRNDRGWSCSLPWIVEEKNFAKIIEGNYENRESA